MGMKRKQIGLWCALLAGSLLFAGCGMKAMNSMDSAPPKMEAISSNSGSAAGGMNYDGMYYEPGMDFAADSAYEQWKQEESGETELHASVEGRKLIKTVRMRVQAVEFDQIVSYLEGQVKLLGGYIEASEINGNGYYYDSRRSASLTLRIPAKELDGFVESVGEIGTVTYKTEEATDVTLQYVDLESRVKSLQIEQERLFDLLGKADSLDSIILLEQRLSEVRYELENYAARLRVYDNQVEYSTVYLTVNEVVRTTPQDETLAEKMHSGFMGTIYEIKDGAAEFAIWFVSNLLYLLFWAAVLAVIVLAVRKQWKKKSDRRQKAAAARKQEENGELGTKE